MARGSRYHASVVSQATLAAAREGKTPNLFLPHTLEAGDEFATGDVYEEKAPLRSKQWNIDTSYMPYLTHVKSLGRGSQRLQYLADFMEVTTSPLKWEFVCDRVTRAERAKRTQVCMLDFQPGRETIQVNMSSASELHRVLQEYSGGHKNPYARLFIVEDLSRTVIESLGAHFDIDPLFFREHISDYLWYNVRDRWVELPDLSLISCQRSYFNLRYMRPWYFRTPEIHTEAEKDTGFFNILRRLEPHPNNKAALEGEGALVGLLRSKTALWVRPNKTDETGVLAVMLVDPTIKHGFPLWGGYNTFEQSPSMHSPMPEQPPRTSAFEDVIFWTKKMTDDEVRQVEHHPEALAEKMLCLVCSEWMILLKYISTRLAHIEWDLENPNFLKDPNCIESALETLHPWRRSVPKYLEMVIQAIQSLSRRGAFSSSPQQQKQGLNKLPEDFLSIKEQLEKLESKIDRLVAVASTTVSIEENKSAFRQNQDVVRLTYLAFIFFPLTFISGIFSMNSDLASLKITWGIYFPVSIALTVITSLLLIGYKSVMDGIRRWTKTIRESG